MQEGKVKKHHAFVVAVSMVTLGVAVSSHAQHTTEEELPNKLEKCYGLAKAGQNSCAASDGSHRCATYAKKEGYGQDFINLPAGVCERIIGGSLEPTEAQGKAVAVKKKSS